MAPLFNPPVSITTGVQQLPWTPRDIPNYDGAINEDFNTSLADFESRWSRFNIPSIAAIDPYSSSAVQVKVDCNTARPSWLRIQPPNDNPTLHGWTFRMPDGVFPANFFLIARMTVSHRVESMLSNDCSFGIHLMEELAGAPSAANMVSNWIAEGDAAVLAPQSDFTVGGATTIVADGGNEMSSGLDVMWCAIQKIGNVNHFWWMADSNNWLYAGSRNQGGFVYAGILARNANSAAPGCMIHSIDWIKSANRIVLEI